MIKRVGNENGGQGGVIVTIASILGLMTLSMAPTYCAVEHGVVSFTKATKDSYATSGVWMVAVCPGFTKTHMVANIPHLTAAENKPENVASAVISIIKNGKNGDIWITENDKAPYPAKDVESYP